MLVDNQQNTSNQPVTGWYKATILRRYFATLIDSLVLFLAYLFSAFIIKTLFGEIIAGLVTLVVGPIYAVFFVWKFGATPGKKWLGIKVVNIQYGPVGFGQALLRETVGKFLSSIVFNLGFLWALWGKDKQAWHDKLAKTYVVTRIPNSGKESRWLFILAAIFLIIPIIAILGAVAILIINPFALTKPAV